MQHLVVDRRRRRRIEARLQPVAGLDFSPRDRLRHSDPGVPARTMGFPNRPLHFRKRIDTNASVAARPITRTSIGIRPLYSDSVACSIRLTYQRRSSTSCAVLASTSVRRGLRAWPGAFARKCRCGVTSSSSRAWSCNRGRSLAVGGARITWRSATSRSPAMLDLPAIPFGSTARAPIRHPSFLVR